MNADEMMYELGFEKVENHCDKVELVYQCNTEMNIGEYFSSNRMGLEM